jgi:phytanoyl-CoA hydroxylase
MLLSDDIHRFRDQGFLVLDGFWSPADVARGCDRAEALLAAVDAGSPAGVFSTLDHRHSAERWFLDSGPLVRPFFEEEAVDADGRLKLPAARAVNKFGHSLHRLDPVFAGLSRGARLAAVAAALGLEHPERRQSMLIVKQPGIGGEVRWHQDASYLYTDPITVTTFWWALEDADADNGCLWVQPGGHRGPLRERFVRDAAGARLVPVDPLPWPERSASVPVPVRAGSLVLMHGLLPHRSDANRSARSRLAYTLHVTDASSRYAADNWLQPSTGSDAAADPDPSGF